MANSPDFIAFLCEQMSPLGPVSARAMFGGHGLYLDGRMFALVADDQLYFKADQKTRPLFEAESLGPFLFETKNGQSAVMSYLEAPGAALDDPEVLLDWARIGFEAALRQKRPAKKARKKPKA